MDVFLLSLSLHHEKARHPPGFVISGGPFQRDINAAVPAAPNSPALMRLNQVWPSPERR